MRSNYLLNVWDQVERTSNFTSNLCKKLAYKRKVAFMHIPKCAGTSIMQCLRRHHRTSWQGHVDGPITRLEYMKNFTNDSDSQDVSQIEHSIYRHRQSILLDYFRRGYPIISGHVPFLASLKSSYPDYFYFTVVRNPLLRWLSCFNYAVKKKFYKEITYELIDEKGVTYALDVMMDSETGFFEAKVLSLFFGEAGKFIYNLNNRKISNNNIVHIFDYIGHTENIAKTEERLREEGIITSRSDIGMYNQSNEKKKKDKHIAYLESMTPKQRTRLENLCESDLEIYEKVLKLTKF